MAQIIKSNGETKTVEPKNGTGFKLEELQAIVGGYIQIAYLRDDEIMVMDDEGKLKEKDLNLQASLRYRRDVNPYDSVVGDVLICKTEQVK
ncbi:MAG: DUF3846 domain-containing protein [Bacteroidaceae bacterium]|nr:DUF3846 domain-containing protein [Bacteroidaceae bacterium]